MRAIALGLSLSAIAFVGLERAAHACSAAYGALERTVFPPPATRVPTNTHIRLTYRDWSRLPGLTEPPVMVRPIGGQHIALEIQPGGPLDTGPLGLSARGFVLRPLEELLPDTTYEILDRIVAPCNTSGADGGAGCLQSEATVVSTFETGPSRDDVAPAFVGVNAVKFGPAQVCEGGSCCGPYHARPVTLSWAPATDDDAPDLIRYNIYRQTDGDGALSPIVRVVSGAQFQGAILCAMSMPIPAGTIRGMGMILEPGTYVVRAVDMAGNEDQNDVAMQVRKTCSESGSTDAPLGADDGFDGSACTIARQGGSGATSRVGLMSLFSMAWIARYARRRIAR